MSTIWLQRTHLQVLFAVAAKLLSQEQCAFDFVTGYSTRVLPASAPVLLLMFLMLMATLTDGTEDLL